MKLNPWMFAGIMAGSFSAADGQPQGGKELTPEQRAEAGIPSEIGKDQSSKTLIADSPAAQPPPVQGYKDTEKLPGVPWGVHDPDRPQPRVIQTAGAVQVKPPSDAIVLFDGKNLDAWTQNGGPAPWEIKDGTLVVGKKDIQTKESFGAIQLHFEWRLPAGRKVSGQGGGNSGFFLMGLYEIQVLQSHDNPTYPDGQAGSLYGQLPPLVNATSPQGEWNSYDITFEPPVYKDGKLGKPAKVTVIHNGVVVQHGESYLGPTQHKKLAGYPEKHPETGPIRIQDHNDPMEYRNIWVRPLGQRDQPAKP